MEKHIGVVKWFHDQAKNANYGFIQHAVLGDLFFHEKSIEQGQNINSFKEDEIVVFTPQQSKKHESKLEAVQVMLLSNEMDLNFLFNHFLSTSFLDVEGRYLGYKNIQKAIHSRIKTLIEKIDDLKTNDDLFIKFKTFAITELKPTLSLDAVRCYFDTCKTFFPHKHSEFSNAVELKINTETAHDLWLAKYIETCQVDYISSIIMSANKIAQQNIFNRCTEQDKLNIFLKVIYQIGVIDNKFKLEKTKIIFNLSNEFASNLHEKILKKALENCSFYYMLLLWMEDYHQELHFDEYKMFIVALNPSNQKKFVKKTLKYIHEGKANISLEELTSINTIDYATSKSFQKNDNVRLDYSTSIILNTILELNNQNKIETKKQEREAQFKIFDLILNQIKEPTDILEIKSYFDECEGRCFASIKEEKADDNSVKYLRSSSVEYHRDKYKKTKLHPICDGRKFLGKDNIPVLCKETNVEYWWCGNQRCYKPSRELHSSNEWEKYTLLDFLIILKINFIEQDFEIYLNIINKANRFLKHLKCRECNHILRPVDKSNFAFYGVNLFNCTNKDCVKSENKPENKIYLTHCLNGRCGQEIDSRDSVKCKPDGVDSKMYGWYICNYCHSCCSTRAIEARVSNMESRGYTYSGHKEGHRDLGIISCEKCGDKMEENKVDVNAFNKVLKWLIDDSKKYDPIHIVKSGINKNGKHWFLFAKKNLSIEEYNLKLHNLLSLGFQIPSIDEDKNSQLIAVPNDFTKHNSEEVLKCNKCHNILDLSKDREQSAAIKYFHNMKQGEISDKYENERF